MNHWRTPRAPTAYSARIPKAGSHHAERIHFSTISDAHRHYLLRWQVVENT
jgi:hypothetical protein